MPRSCPVCTSPLKKFINARLAANEALVSIATFCGLTTNQLAYHRREGHTKNLPAIITVGTPDAYHQDLDDVYVELRALFDHFMEKNKQPMALSCLREIRFTIEAKAKLAGAYKGGSDPTNPMFQRLKQLLSDFAVKNPEIREPLLMLLDEAQHGDDK